MLSNVELKRQEALELKRSRERERRLVKKAARLVTDGPLRSRDYWREYRRLEREALAAQHVEIEPYVPSGPKVHPVAQLVYIPPVGTIARSFFANVITRR